MKTAMMWLVVAGIVGLAVTTATVWAQEEEQAKTPQQVVSEFGDAAVFTLQSPQVEGEELKPLMGLVTEHSREKLQSLGSRLVDPLTMCMLLPRLEAEEPAVDGETATVAALPQPRSLQVKLVKEEGQWKVDLLATLAGLPEPFAVTAEDLAAQAAGLLGPTAPEPQSGEQLPAADSSEVEQTGPVIEITLSNFKEEVLEAEIPVLLEFWGYGCDACDELKPVFNGLARDYAGTVRFGSVNANRNIPLAIAYEVNRIPCLVLLRGGEELARDIGYKNQQELRDWIERNLVTEN